MPADEQRERMRRMREVVRRPTTSSAGLAACCSTPRGIRKRGLRDVGPCPPGQPSAPQNGVADGMRVKPPSAGDLEGRGHCALSRYRRHAAGAPAASRGRVRRRSAAQPARHGRPDGWAARSPSSPGGTIAMVDRLFAPLHLPIGRTLRAGASADTRRPGRTRRRAGGSCGGRRRARSTSSADTEGIYFERKGAVLAIHTRAAPAGVSGGQGRGRGGAWPSLPDRLPHRRWPRRPRIRAGRSAEERRDPALHGDRAVSPAGCRCSSATTSRTRPASNM